MACLADHQQQEEKPRNICEECNIQPYKYKCPGCSRRTCSLSCVTSHKKSSGCSGKRDRTKFLPLSLFDDSTLLSDYYLLEDIKRIADSAKRMRTNLCGYHQFTLPEHLKRLGYIASRKGTKLFFLPEGMSKRQKNKTRFKYINRSKNKHILWTIEWRFHLTDVVLLEHGVRDDSTLRSVIQNHLQPSPWRNKLRRFSKESLDNLKLFIRINQKNPELSYRELDLDTPLWELFAGLAIVEYPVIHTYLSSDSYDFRVVKFMSRSSKLPESKEPITREDTSSPVGIFFKEEEIVEDERAPEPQIIDLLKSSEADAHERASGDVQMNGKLPNESSSTELKKCSPTTDFTGHSVEGDDDLSSMWCTEVEMLDTKIEDFSFDQDLINAYSYLMEQSNPDDFLDYNPEGLGDHVNTDVYLVDEELEEGEIPNSD